jgi:hypothetical protein
MLISLLLIPAYILAIWIGKKSKEKERKRQSKEFLGFWKIANESKTVRYGKKYYKKSQDV